MNHTKKNSEKSDSEVTSNPTFWEHQTARTIPATRWRLVACFDSYGNRCEADMQVTLPSTDIFSPAATHFPCNQCNQPTHLRVWCGNQNLMTVAYTAHLRNLMSTMWNQSWYTERKLCVILYFVHPFYFQYRSSSSLLLSVLSSSSLIRIIITINIANILYYYDDCSVLLYYRYFFIQNHGIRVKKHLDCL